MSSNPHEIFDKLGHINVCLKPQGEAADLDEPLIIREGCTVGDMCDRLHKDFRRKFRYARVWAIPQSTPASASASTTF